MMSSAPLSPSPVVMPRAKKPVSPLQMQVQALRMSLAMEAEGDLEKAVACLESCNRQVQALQATGPVTISPSLSQSQSVRLPALAAETSQILASA